MRKLGRNYELRLYAMLFHFAHGSVSALQMLDGQVADPEGTLACFVNSTYPSYLDSSCAFLGFIWAPVVTTEGEACKSEFADVMAIYVGQGGA